MSRLKSPLILLLGLGFLLVFHYFDDKTLADELTGGLPLSRAAFRGNSAEVADLLKSGVTAGERDREGNTPLHWATGLQAHQRFEHGDHEGCARQLIASGADVNAINNSQETPLYRAVWNPRFTYILVKSGADPNRGAHSRTPLISASYMGESLCVDAIQSMQILLSAGANVNAQESSGFSALTTAAIYGCPPMVKFLLAGGADPNARTANGETILATLTRYERIADGGVFTRMGRGKRQESVAIIRIAGGRE